VKFRATSAWPVIRTLITLALALSASLTFQGKAHAGAYKGLPVVSSLSDARIGTLLLQEGDHYVEAPRLATDMDITVAGPSSRPRVTQIFSNPASHWVEAIYINPLPDGGAVDTLKMVIGDRIIVGEIKERVEATHVYEAAERAGRKATLIEQERANIFKNSVANIGPGETVLVQIEYQQPVTQSGAASSLRIPLVVAPRYTPAGRAERVDVNDSKEAKNRADSVDVPVLDPRLDPPVNPVAITVRLNAGFPIGAIKSPSHAIKIESISKDERLIRLDNKVVPADRDFELTWTAAASAAPSVGLFREHVGGSDYLLALVTPPVQIDTKAPSPPRQIVLVIDNSGSMAGTSIAQAKASLLFALDRLKPNDRFNVIRFDHSMDILFEDTVTADSANIADARQFVQALDASGGTEMVPPLKAALTDRRGPDSPYLRQIVFLTDGEIDNEEELFDTIATLRGRSRLFMVGIGSSPNSFLMTHASQIGRGTYTHIGSVEQVQERMRELIEKLESPVATSLTASFSGGVMDATPGVLPDLYGGEPVVLVAKLSAANGNLEIKGNIGSRPWMVTVPVANASPGTGLSKLWARRKITDAEMARRLNQIQQEEADRRVLQLSLDNHLVSRLTSLVAIDQTPSRPIGATLKQSELPLNLPAGWDFDKVFGSATGGKALRQPERRADAVDLYLAKGQAEGVILPKTATDASLRLITGVALLLFSLLIARRAKAIDAPVIAGGGRRSISRADQSFMVYALVAVIVLCMCRPSHADNAQEFCRNGSFSSGSGFGVERDHVLTAQKKGGYVCALYPSPGGGAAGWVEQVRLRSIPVEGGPKLSDWTRVWVDGDNQIRLTREGDAPVVHGDAYWPSAHPSLEERPGGPHIGEVNAAATPTGNQIVFKDEPCRVSATLVRRSLLSTIIRNAVA
jgi:Ca-activated chloride channel homolog